MKTWARIVAVAGLAVLPLAVSTATAAPGGGEGPDPAEGFRVLPYLQSPGTDSMTLNWISELDQPGTLTVRGPGLRGPFEVSSAPEYLDLMQYSDAELTQEIPGLEQGSWLLSHDNYRHTVTVDGLRAHQSYRYSVEQSGETFEGTFTTAPTADKTMVTSACQMTRGIMRATGSAASGGTGPAVRSTPAETMS